MAKLRLSHQYYASAYEIGAEPKDRAKQVPNIMESKDDMGTNNYSLGLDPSGYPQFFFYMNWVPLWRIGSWTGQGLGGVPKLTPKIFNFTFNFIFMNYQDEITLMYSITDLKALPKTRFVLHE